MDLAELLFQLKPLIDGGDDNWPAISALLNDHTELVEYEVARHYVNKAIAGSTNALLRSIDPRERREGIDRVKLTYPRSRAAQVLRHMVKDSDSTVRSHARGAVRKLAIEDVALPNSNHTPREPITAQTRGGWNPTGWLYHGRAASPTRAAALDKLDLPAITTVKQLAKLIEIKPEDFDRLMRPGTKSGAPYVEFEIEKATGGKRRISAPRAELKRVQRILLEQILSKVPVHDACHGFVARRSVVTNAEPHQQAAVVIKMDLRDFFPTVHYRRVAGLFRSLGYSDTIANALAGLTTHRPVLDDGTVVWPGALPQGAPTSPSIANLVARSLDRRLAGLAARVGARYTRYADDLTFSFAETPELPIGRFCWWVDQICQQEGFIENVAKRRILRRGNQQRVTGVVVNSGLFVPRAARRRFRAILHNCRTNGVEAEARGREDFADYLRGFAAYVKMVQPELGGRLIAEVAAVLDGAES
jgi:hypothetical protein